MESRRVIKIAQGITGTLKSGAGLPKLTIRKNGKITGEYRGSSLYFSNPLTAEDRRYLESLARI